jgi:hypothetical protein
MKTFVTIVVSAALGFAIMFWCVPRRPPEQIPVAWLELPGMPQSVDGRPTRTWEEVNQALRRVSASRMTTDSFVNALGGATVEIQLPPIRVSYVPWALTGNSDGDGVETVTVRPWFPNAVLWSRANQVDLLRYEVERPLSVE